MVVLNNKSFHIALQCHSHCAIPGGRAFRDTEGLAPARPAKGSGPCSALGKTQLGVTQGSSRSCSSTQGQSSHSTTIIWGSLCPFSPCLEQAWRQRGCREMTWASLPIPHSSWDNYSPASPKSTCEGELLLFSHSELSELSFGLPNSPQPQRDAASLQQHFHTKLQRLLKLSVGTQNVKNKRKKKFNQSGGFFPPSILQTSRQSRTGLQELQVRGGGSAWRTRRASWRPPALPCSPGVGPQCRLVP